MQRQQADLDIARQVDGELGGTEDMLGLGPLGQQIVWSHPPNEGTLARLAHAKVAGIQHPKPYLITSTHDICQVVGASHDATAVEICLFSVKVMAAAVLFSSL